MGKIKRAKNKSTKVIFSQEVWNFLDSFGTCVKQNSHIELYIYIHYKFALMLDGEKCLV